MFFFSWLVPFVGDSLLVCFVCYLITTMVDKWQYNNREVLVIEYKNLIKRKGKHVHVGARLK